MAAKKKRRRRRKMTASTLDGYQQGLDFASKTLADADGGEFLAGFMDGAKFAIKNGAVGPKKRRRRKKAAKKRARKKAAKKAAKSD